MPIRAQLRTAARAFGAGARLTAERLRTGVVYNPVAAANVRDPYPAYARLRARDPIHWSGLARGWLLLRHADVEAALRDPARLSSDFRHDPLTRGQVQVIKTPSLLGLDPPDHTRLRQLVIRAFTPAAIRSLRPRVEAIVDGLLDDIERTGRGGFDLIAALAFPLPVIVIAELIGVPAAEREQFRRWSGPLARTVDPGCSLAERAAGAAAGRELRDYFRGVIADRGVGVRRGAPPGDLTDRLMEVVDDESGDRLAAEEFLSMLRLLLVAGNETTTNLIGNGVLALLRHPEQLEWLRADPGARIDGAVEELLRYDSPVQLDRRIARADVALGGRTIRRGERVFPVIGAANRDPEAFDDPDSLLLNRDPRSHLSFGRGIHHCLGAALARLEGAVAMHRLIARFPGLRLAGAPRHRRQIALRGLSVLPLALDG